MQAINHVATALILKRKYPSAPLFGLIIATEAVEYLWVIFNLLGVEATTIAIPMRSVADVSLVHMPYSHSILTGALASVVVGLITLWRGGKTSWAVASACSLAIFSHILLDLLVHAPDIAFSPFSGDKKYGTGFYSTAPLSALAFETLWGIICWRIYRGSWALLTLILVLGISSVPFYSIVIDMGESALGGQPITFTLVIFMQMLATSGLVWLFAQRRTEATHFIGSPGLKS